MKNLGKEHPNSLTAIYWVLLCVKHWDKHFIHFLCFHHSLWKSCFYFCFAGEETETQNSNLPEDT